MTMSIILAVIGFILGSVPFSLCLGKLLLKSDIRDYGDGNPGAANALRAGGFRIGVPALILDYLKGAIPVFISCQMLKIYGWHLVLVSVAPVLGHAFSPFLKFRGGKAVAVTFGIWTGLTLWEGPLVFGLSLQLFYILQSVDGWSVILGMLGLLVYVILRRLGLLITMIWLANFMILAWKHRSDLRQGLKLKPSVLKLMRRKL